jgi:hypothetical protein
MTFFAFMAYTKPSLSGSPWHAKNNAASGFVDQSSSRVGMP